MTAPPQTTDQQSRGRTGVVAVYVTFPDIATAEAIGRETVTAGLAACANLIPGMRSIYRWRGAIEEGDEIVGILKTRADLVDPLISAIEAVHPYETPAIVVLPIENGSEAYLDWINAETATEK